MMKLKSTFYKYIKIYNVWTISYTNNLINLFVGLRIASEFITI